MGIARHEDFVHDAMVQEHFGDVYLSMFTLFQVLTLDRWTGVVRPLMRKQGWTVFFFVFFISVASFILMNLVTAMLVEQAFTFMRQDEKEKEKAKEKELSNLKSIFVDLDEDGNGQLTR